ncbi:MAG: glycosyltransferase [Desulfobulbaceae bacterium]|jgi:UDP-N-acetylglucosamine transferase subunit ALG13|nr:glycosyltransferase [Desulfobulbaceae bacterium]
MILVTVGAQLPFDRLIRTVDEWARGNNRSDVFAQTGKTEWLPTHIEAAPFLSPQEFQDKFAAADLIVAHAGMGTIINALEYGKPILVMPRKASLGEHRNDHQLATANRFLALNYVDVAFDEEELIEKLNDFCKSNHELVKPIGPSANPELIKTIQQFVEQA